MAVSAKEADTRRDGESCRQGVAAATATADWRFAVGSTALTPAFYPGLDALAALAKTCPDLRVAVSGPADPPGAKPPPTEEPKKPAEKKLARRRPRRRRSPRPRPSRRRRRIPASPGSGRRP